MVVVLREIVISRLELVSDNMHYAAFHGIELYALFGAPFQTELMFIWSVRVYFADVLDKVRQFVYLRNKKCSAQTLPSGTSDLTSIQFEVCVLSTTRCLL